MYIAGQPNVQIGNPGRQCPSIIFWRQGMKVRMRVAGMIVGLAFLAAFSSEAKADFAKRIRWDLLPFAAPVT